MSGKREEFRLTGISKRKPERGRVAVFPITSNRDLALRLPKQYVAANYTDLQLEQRTVTETEWEPMPNPRQEAGR